MVPFLIFIGVISVLKSEDIDKNEWCDSNIDCKLFQYMNANITITAEQKQSYQENGFLILRNALSNHQVQLWRELIDNSVDSRGIDHIFPVKGQMDTVNPEFQDFYKNVFTQRLNLWQNDEEVCKLVGSAGYTIGRIISELEGIDGVQLHHDQALYKEPFANPTAFHVDTSYWTFSSLHGSTCWVALDKATQQNGCLHYIAGSHKIVHNKTDPYVLVKIGKNMNEIFETAYPEFMDDKYKCIAAEMNAGDMVFHNGLVIHAAGPNLTNKRRRAMTLGMFPQGSVFNGKKNILTDQQFENMKVGQLLNDVNQNPVLYSKQKPVNNHQCFF